MMMDGQLTPYKPDEEEQKQYYFDMAGSPRLIARTSPHRWTRPESRIDPGYGGQLRKLYAPLADHTIVSKWTTSLQSELVKALASCAWVYFFPICIGLEEDAASTFPTVLLVAIQKDTLHWEQGIQLALQCRSIIANYGLRDIEVELHEGEYQPYAASARVQRAIDPLAWGTNDLWYTNMLALPVLSHPGYPITHESGGAPVSTVGLHVQLGETEEVYALTCQHVVERGSKADETSTIKEGAPLNFIQPGKQAVEDCLEVLKEYQDGWTIHLERFQRRQKEWDDYAQYDKSLAHKALTEEDIAQMNSCRNTVDYTGKVIEAVSTLATTRDWKIGSLEFQSTLEMSAEQAGYRKDWALIKLNLDNIAEVPANKVFVDRSTRPHRLPGPLDNGFIQLHLGEPGWKDGTPLDVWKRGPTTDLTFGRTNGVEAVIRVQSQSSHQVTTEIVVVPAPFFGKKVNSRFSGKGDSGSMVFDKTGAIIGMLVASNAPAGAGLHHYTAADVTFVSPIKWVLEDIQKTTGLKPKLAQG